MLKIKPTIPHKAMYTMNWNREKWSEKVTNSIEKINNNFHKSSTKNFWLFVSDFLKVWKNIGNLNLGLKLKPGEHKQREKSGKFKW